MASRVNLVNILSGSVFNGVVTGASFYLLETKLAGYSPWQKAAMASAVGTVSLGFIAMLLSPGGNVA